MALPSAVCTVQDGSATAVSASAAAVQVTPGNTITVALNSTTAVVAWTMKVRYTDNPLLLGQSFSMNTTSTSFTFTAPNQPFILVFDSEVTDTFNAYTSVVAIQGGFPQVYQPFKARNVLNGAVTLSTYTITSSSATNDAVANVQGDVVLAIAQASVKANGLYVCGPVVASVCALARAPGFATGTVLSPQQIVQVSEGTLFQNTEWKASNAAPVTVDTTSTTWYPRYVAQAAVLVAGALTVSNVPILSSTQTTFTYNRRTNSSVTSTVSYQATAITAGALGTATLSIMAQVAAGTINASDSSTLTFGVLNF
jgi:hypothetical protein